MHQNKKEMLAVNHDEVTTCLIICGVTAWIIRIAPLQLVFITRSKYSIDCSTTGPVACIPAIMKTPLPVWNSGNLHQQAELHDHIFTDIESTFLAHENIGGYITLSCRACNCLKAGPKLC